MGKSDTLPFSLFKVAIKGSCYNLSVILAVVYNERLFSVFIWEYISWRISVGAVNQTGNEKFYRLFFFQKKLK